MRRPVPFLIALALLHGALALAFVGVSPWRTPGVSNGIRLADIGAPDEIAHANYVEAIRAGRGFPVLRPESAAQAATYEDHQPPLFYSLDAAVGRLAGVSVSEPSAKVPLRALNALFGMAAVVLTFLFAQTATGRPKPALASAAIVALLPMNLALSGAVSNDPLLIALTTAFLAVGAVHVRRPTLRLAVSMGALAGLAILTKFTALLLLVVLPIFVRGRTLAAAWGVALVVSGPWLVRNVLVYGHPLAANAFNATFERTVDLGALRTPYGLAHWLYVLLAGTAESGLGEFGYMDIHLPGALAYPLIGILVAVALAGLRLPDVPSRVRFASWTLLGLLALGYVSYNLWQVQPQARYLFPALAPLALMAVLGTKRLAGHHASVALGAITLGLLAADLVALATLPHEYAVRAERAGLRPARERS